jgi:hypothetical protein
MAAVDQETAILDQLLQLRRPGSLVLLATSGADFAQKFIFGMDSGCPSSSVMLAV